MNTLRMMLAFSMAATLLLVGCDEEEEGDKNNNSENRDDLLSDTDVTAQCESEKKRRMAVQPSDAVFAEVFCTVGVNDSMNPNAPTTKEECEAAVAMCVANPPAALEMAKADVFRFDCTTINDDLAESAASDATVGDLLDCWAAESAELQRILGLTCDDVGTGDFKFNDQEVCEKVWGENDGPGPGDGGVDAG